jgi:1-phosphofructokinase family hexose kinase
MIHAVLLNPTIDLIYKIENFQVGGTFKVNEKVIFPVGKAISYSLAVKEIDPKININIYALVGKNEIVLYSKFLKNHNLSFTLIPVEGETRSNKTINDPVSKSTTHIRELGFSVRDSDLNELKNQLSENIKSGDLCVFSGSIPPNTNQDIYFELIKLAKKQNTLTCLDSSGNPLIEGIKANPTIIKPNLIELNQILDKKIIKNIDLNEPSKAYSTIIEETKILLNNELQTIAITLGKKGALLLTEEYNLFGNVLIDKPILDTVGSGDSFLAGLTTQYIKTKNILESFGYAIAAGAANTLKIGPGILNYNDFTALLRHVVIKKIN